MPLLPPPFDRRRALAALLGLFTGAAHRAAAPRTAAGARREGSGRETPDREILVEGRAVCLRDGVSAPPSECSFGEAFGIESPDGTIHRLDPADPRVEILTDERVSAHPLRVALWMEDGLGNILRLHTIRDGEEIEPYYFCSTCNITSHIPGPCWCCQQEFDFEERPAEPTR